MPSSSQSDVILIGNNVALMVAAREMANAGKRVTMLLDGKPPGAHFGGIQIEGYCWDIGMVLFEQATRGAQSRQVQDYCPRQRNDCARFAEVVADYVAGFIDTVAVPTPSVYLDGIRHPDFIIANRLDYFASTQCRDEIRAALSTLPAPGALHAENKFAETHNGLSYRQVSLANHAQPLHALFDLLGRKITHLSTDAILARFHRLAWLPLYYPETLQQVIQGRPQSLPEYPFRASADGFSGAFVRALTNALQESGVEMISNPLHTLSRQGQAITAASDGQYVWQAERVALGLPLARAGVLLGMTDPAPTGASVRICFGLIRRDRLVCEDACLLVLDADKAVYRMTNQDVAAGTGAVNCRVSVELNPGYAAELYGDCSTGALLARVAQELVSMGVIADATDFQVLRSIEARGALPVANEHLVAYTSELADLAADWSGLQFTAGLLGVGVSSFNDQVIQGLKLADSWST